MNLLYYPKVLVPVQELKRLVLYSDTISTIVPDEFQFEFGDDSEWNQAIIALKELEKLGIYKKTNAKDVLRECKEDIFNEFNERLKSLQSYKKIKEGYEPTTWWQLYLSKMDYELRSMLVDIGLAELQGDTLFVENDVASLYMGLLAEYSCLSSEVFYSSVTDKAHFKELVYNPVADKVIKTKFVLNNILPVPNEITSLEQILDFKQKHKDELLKFQQLLSSFESDLINISDLREYRSKLESIERSLKIQSNELGQLLNEHKITCIANTIDKVVNVIPKIVKNCISNGEIISVSPIVEKYYQHKNINAGSEVSYLLHASKERI